MRIIAGTCKGQRLILPPGPVRPLTDRIKESLFSILQPDLEAADICDLFAGSGSFGLEAVSRGARQAVFVEQDPETVRLLRENLNHTRLTSQGVVRQEDVFRFLAESRETFDLLFMDPPFPMVKGGAFFAKVTEMGTALADRLNPAGFLIIRIPTAETGPADIGGLALVREKKYGRSRVLFYEGS
jgi:16S rRNA (guanine966-N2)-methyltransferase